MQWQQILHPSYLRAKPEKLSAIRQVTKQRRMVLDLLIECTCLQGRGKQTGPHGLLAMLLHSTLCHLCHLRPLEDLCRLEGLAR